MDINSILTRATRDRQEPTFRQALQEFLEHVLPHLEATGGSVADLARLERLLIPERTVSFKVVWENDAGEVLVNRGCRVQFNSALGPYKGGLRFDASVNEDILKFLGFEQIFKNALTGLPLGGGKGGSDFDPKGKSDREIQRFCVAFMSELARHIGPTTDVPAGDIGVGSREIGYLYGAYKRIVNRSDGTLTGKGVAYNGSYVRTEATGYGAIYFIQHVLAVKGEQLVGKRVAVSGSGNVATYAAQKAVTEGAVVLTLSDRGGYLYAPEGLTDADIKNIIAHKAAGKALAEFVCAPGTTYHEGTFWQTLAADIYIPAATQNEVSATDAAAMATHKPLLVAEAANMPLTLEAAAVIREAGIVLAPSKAVNAGGVAVSGLEMAQNAGHRQWTAIEVDSALREIMQHIHETCVTYGTNAGGDIDYIKGANIGGFTRVFRAMKELGW